MINKKELKEKFRKDWKKHYKIQYLIDKGFVRKKCKTCDNYFWTLDADRETCADSSCAKYEFIGRPTKRYDYVETWNQIEKYFKKNGHTSIPRYPTVCRWRDDLYFTNASIIDFQPYVVTGEIEPPANPLIVPQASIRFPDVGNVGVTGRHYTSFIMFGQHAFNSKKTGLFYWKDEAIRYDYEFVTKVLGAKKDEVVFQEEVWAGGGTFGPCIEYCVNGVELGNCVFMQYKDLGNGKFKELDTKVIDMGAGLERFAWFTNGTPTSYETTFGPVIQNMKKDSGVKYDEKLFLEYAKISGILDVEEQGIKGKRKLLAKQLGTDEKELFGMLKPLQALYASADHLKTILYTATDGMLPSNSGGGYNLRLLLRRVFTFDKEFGFDLNYHKILEDHAKFLAGFDDTLAEGVVTAVDVIEEEKKKYAANREKASRKITGLAEKLKKKNEMLKKNEMIRLYESDGIPHELMEEFSKKEGFKIEEVENFYGLVSKKNEKEEKKQSIVKNKYAHTKMLFYEDSAIDEFNAKVVGLEGKYLILDKSAFYPEGGGQATDMGKIDGVQVLDVQKQEGVILHTMKSTDRFKKNQKVFGQVDFVRRKILEKQHTGAHLLNAACRQVLGNHIWQAGAHKDINKAHLDITHFKRIADSELEKIELVANKFIQENVSVTSKFYARNEAEEKFGFRLYQGGYVPGKEIRVINVYGIDVEACGGMHVHSTGELGVFKILKRESVKDGVERLTYNTGIPAMQHIQMKERWLKESADNLGVPQNELVPATAKFFREWKDYKKQIQNLEEQYIYSKSEKFSKSNKEVFFTFIKEKSVSGDVLRKIGANTVEKNPALTLVLGSGNGSIVIASGNNSDISAKEQMQNLSKKGIAVGGGSDRLAQGKAKDINKLKEYLSE